MVIKKRHSRPIPRGAKIFTRKGIKYAEWKVRTRKLTARVNETGDRIITESKKWYCIFTDDQGVHHDVKAYTDKTASEQMHADLIKKAERGEVGLVDTYAKHRRKPIEYHLDDFERHLESLDDTEKHIKLTVQRVKSVLQGIQVENLGDIAGDKVNDYLKHRRDQGLSVESSNHYFRAIRSFCLWLVSPIEKRLAANPLEGIQCLNADKDRRVRRRALADGEFTALVGAARAGGTFRGLTGEDRAMLYLTAFYSGLRASECASLTPESFDFKRRVLSISAADTKNAAAAEIPLRADVVDILAPWVKSRTPGAALWPGTWCEKAARMMRVDMEAAKIEPVNSAGKIDFHSLRHSFCTNLARAGVSASLAQVLTRHKTVEVMLKHYTHLSLRDLDGAVSKLPGISKGVTQSRAI